MSRFNFFLIIMIVAFVFSECRNHDHDKLSYVQKVYNDKNNLTKNFDTKSIVIRGSLIILKEHTLTKDNIFYFEKKDTNNNPQGYQLTHYEINDTIAMNLFEGFSVKTSSDEVRFKKGLETLVKKYTDTMSQYSIKEITSEFVKQGIDLKFYLEGNTSILYVKNFAMLNGSWKEYITNAKKLDNNWYYYFDEIPKD